MSNQNQNNIEVIMTEEEANKYLNSFKEKMGYKDISLILKSEALNNNDEEDKEELKKLKTIRNKLIEGIRIGIIFFDEEIKGITQKLLYPFEYNGNIVEEICFFKRYGFYYNIVEVLPQFQRRLYDVVWNSGPKAL